MEPLQSNRRLFSDGLSQIQNTSSDGVDTEVDVSYTSDEARPSQEISVADTRKRVPSSSSSSTSSSQPDGCGHDCDDAPRRPDVYQKLSSKYQPKVFHDIVGHGITIRAMCHAIQSKRTSPLYLFHGPGGTGKTSAAKLFATALNCESSAAPVMRPCRACTGCSNSASAAESFSSISVCFEKIHAFQQGTTQGETSSGIKAFIIEIELFSTKSSPWGELLNLAKEFEDKMYGSAVLILIIEDATTVPSVISSRCQKFNFFKLGDTDILLKLLRVVVDHLTLLDSKISTSMIQQFVGLVPRKKLICLLKAAISGNSTKAVKHTRYLIGAGIEPQVLLAQLVSLVTELIADNRSSLPVFNAGSKQPERLVRTLKILTETEKTLTMVPCNQITWINAAVLQIASDGCCSKHIAADESPHDARNLNSGYTNSSRLAETADDSKIQQHQLTNLITEQLDSIIAAPKADNSGFDMDKLWKNILKRIKNKSSRDFLQCQAKLMSFTASRANAIIHLMIKHSEQMPESIESALKAALKCSVTLNISRAPVQPVTDTENCSTEISKPANLTVSSMDGGGFLMRPRVSQTFVPTEESNSKSTKLRDTIHISTEGTGYGINVTQSGLNPSFPDHLIHGSRETSFKDPTRRHYRNVEIPGTAFDAKSAEVKFRLLSLSSIPQTDASVEPYSQDLMFENGNTDRKQGERNSRQCKDFLRPKHPGHSISYMNRRLNRSRSCSETLRRGEEMANEVSIAMAKRSHSVKWANPCRDSLNINRIMNRGQSDSRKTLLSL